MAPLQATANLEEVIDALKDICATIEATPFASFNERSKAQDTCKKLKGATTLLSKPPCAQTNFGASPNQFAKGLAQLFKFLPKISESNAISLISEINARQEQWKEDCLKKGGKSYKAPHGFLPPEIEEVRLENGCTLLFVTTDKRVGNGKNKKITRSFLLPDWEECVYVRPPETFVSESAANKVLKSFQREVRFSGLIQNFPDSDREGLPQFMAVGDHGIFMKAYPTDSMSWRKTFPDNEDPTYRVLSLMIDIGQALIHLKKHGIVHGDLKAMNILVDPVDGKSHGILIDFGQGYMPLELLSKWKEDPSKLVDRPLQDPASASLRKIQSDEIQEKWDTSSEAQIIENEHKLDVYSFAITTIELLDAFHPFPLCAYTQDKCSLRQIISERKELLNRLEEKKSPLTQLLHKAIQENPNDQPPLEEMVRIYRELLPTAKLSSPIKKNSKSPTNSLWQRREIKVEGYTMLDKGEKRPTPPLSDSTTSSPNVSPRGNAKRLATETAKQIEGYDSTIGTPRSTPRGSPGGAPRGLSEESSH